MSTQGLVEFRHVGKSYAGTRALTDVSVSISKGSVHALVGENGAGKSTLGKILAGIVRHDEGEVVVDGAVRRFRSPREATSAGVAAIHQEITLVQSRAVLDNVFLGIERHRAGLVNRRAAHARFTELLSETGFDLDPRALVRSLSPADQQKVEILRALARGAHILVMDEPTATLGADEKEKLQAIVRRLRDRGVTIIYVSHFLEEVLELADDVTVLRDGHVIRTGPARTETTNSLVEAMLGRPLTRVFPPKTPAPPGEPVLRVERLTRAGEFRDVSFTVRRGEILGIAGLVGSGRSELVQAIFGHRRADSGEVRRNGTGRRFRSPRAAIDRGFALVPEDRKSQGLLLSQSIGENIVLPRLGRLSHAGFAGRRPADKRVRELIDDLLIRPARSSARVESLSGGNQQKVLFAKWLLQTPDVLLVDEPTRGVDIDGKHAIYELIARLARDGLGVVVVSSEMEEILGLAHRVLVMSRGEVVRELEGEDITEPAVMEAAFANQGTRST